MKLIGKNKKKSIGQTALEYALVVAVVAAVIVFAASSFFGNSESGVGKQVFQKAVNSVSKSIDEVNQH